MDEARKLKNNFNQKDVEKYMKVALKDKGNYKGKEVNWNFIDADVYMTMTADGFDLRMPRYMDMFDAAADKLDPKNMKESADLVEAAAPGSTAQHGPDDATRDTYQKQMGVGKNSIPMSKKEDIVNQHTAEVALDAEAIYKQNQEEAEKAVKQGAGRLGDQRKGDTSFVNPIKSEIIDGITKALQQMKTNS